MGSNKQATSNFEDGHDGGAAVGDAALAPAGSADAAVAPDAAAPPDAATGPADAATVDGATYATQTRLAIGIFFGLTHDATNVYTILESSTSQTPTAGTPVNEIVQIPIAGGAIATPVTGQLDGYDLTASNGPLYWFAEQAPPPSSTASATWSLIAQDGTTQSQLATQVGAGVTLEFGASPTFSLALGGGNVYWSVQGVAKIYSVAKTGGTVTSVDVPTAVASQSTSNGFWSINLVGADASNLYWSDNGGIETMPLAGGAQSTVLAGAHQLLAVDGGTLYYADYVQVANPVDVNVAYSATLYARSSSTGATTAIASNVLNLHGFANDASSVYWVQGPADDSASQLMMMAKSGGTPTQIASEGGNGSNGSNTITLVTAAGGNVYFIGQNSLSVLTP